MKKKICGAILTVVMALSLCCGVVLAFALPSDPVFHISDTIAESYSVGDTLRLRGGTAEYGGEEYALSWELRFPNGNTTSYAEAVLSQEGEYTLRYFFTAAGESAPHEQTVTFRAESTPAYLFTSGGGVTASAQVQSAGYAVEQRTGVELVFNGNNSSTQYKSPLDLSDNTQDDSFVEFLIAPFSSGIGELSSFNIRLTDISDSSVWVNLRFEPLGWGYEDASSIAISHNGSGSRTFGDYYGNASETSYVSSSFYGEINGKKSNTIKLSYDPSEKAFYAYYHHGSDSFTLMADLDNEEYVGDWVWDGFPSGRVYLSVTAEEVYAGQAHMLFYSIDDADLSGAEIDVPFYESAFNIDLLGYAEDALPYGVAGMSYPVFAASAYDNIGNVYRDIDVAVYRQGVSGGDTQYEYVPVKGGRFETQEAGTYYIRYSFTDNSGERKEKTLPIEVRSAYDTPLGYAVSPLMQEAYDVGELVVVYDGEPSGGSGELRVERQVYFKETQDGAAEEIEIRNDGLIDYLIPDRQGYYTFVWTVTDMLNGTYSAEFTFAADFAEDYTLEEPYFPRSVLTGATLVLPEAEAYRVTGGGRETADVTVTVNGTDVTDTMRWEADAAGTLTIVYSAAGQSWQYTVQVKDPVAADAPYCSNLITTENLQGSYNDAARRYILTAQQAGDAGFSFDRKISARDFSISFETFGESAFGSMRIVLTDSERAGESIELRIERLTVDGKIVPMLYVGGIAYGVISGSADGSSSEPLQLRYSSDTNMVSDYAGSAAAEVAVNRLGTKFEGFSSGFVYAEVYFDDVAADFRIAVQSVGNQSFGNYTTDMAPPVFLFEGDPPTSVRAEVGDRVTVEMPFVYDICSDSVTLEMTLTAPSGTQLYSGVMTGEYTFTVEETGSYNVIYIARDANGGMARTVRYIRTIDTEAPTLSVSGVPTEVSAGQSVTFPEATVNGDGNCCIVVIDTAAGKYVPVSGNSYVFPAAGSYIVRYIAYDSSFNTTGYDFTVTAK